MFGHDNHFVVGTSVDHGRIEFPGYVRTRYGRPELLFVTGTGVIIDQPAGRYHPGQSDRQEYLCRCLRDQHLRHHLAAVLHGRRPLQLRADRSAGQHRRQPAAHQQQQFPALQSGGRPDLPDHAEPHRLCRLFGSQPRADTARARMFRSCHSLPDRQLPDRRSAAQAGGVAHDRRRPARRVVRRRLRHRADPLPRKAPTKVVDNGWRLRWGVGLFRTENTDDIINVASDVVPNFGFFQNAGTTLRQGVEAKVDLSWNRWTAYANYTFVDATFQSSLTLASPTIRWRPSIPSLARPSSTSYPATIFRRFRRIASSSARNMPSPMPGSLAPTSTILAASICSTTTPTSIRRSRPIGSSTCTPRTT